MIKRHRLIAFYTMALALSWYSWIYHLIRGTPGGGLNPLGPLAAALLVSALTEGRKGVADLLKRVARWRVAPQWYAVVLLLPVAICFFAADLNWLIGAPLPDASMLEGWRELPDRFLFIFLFIGLGEEPGWRGFALAQLQKKRTPLLASLILAPLWALWHLPLMGTEIALPMVAPFLIGILSATLLGTCIYNRTNGSVLLQMMFHSMVNTIGSGFVFPMFTGSDLLRLWWIFAFTWFAVALLAVSTQGDKRRDVVYAFSKRRLRTSL